MKNITYKINEKPDIKIIKAMLYKADYLPIADMEDEDRLRKMFDNADLIVTAWDGDSLVGISRSLCDFSYCCYLSDLCVDTSYRKLNIGRRLIEITKQQAGEVCKLILHSSQEALDFYQKIGMTRISDAFIIQRTY